MRIKVGDVVCRRSYGCDIFFNVVDIKGEKAFLVGIFQRLYADAFLDDLIPVDPERVKAFEAQTWKPYRQST